MSAGTNKDIIPDFKRFCANLKEIFDKCQYEDQGELWDILEEHSTRCEGSSDEWCLTASSFQNKWGMAVRTVDGKTFSAGDAGEAFTIQDVSKAVSYALTVTELGEETVHRFQGKEPSGRRRNEIVLDESGKPHNPLINAGGIMSACLLLRLVRPDVKSPALKYEHMFQFVKYLCRDGALGFNNSLFLRQTRESMDSEFELAYLMRRRGCLPDGVSSADIDKILQFYFQLRCLEMTCRSLASVGAALAAATAPSSSGGAADADAFAAFQSAGQCSVVDGGQDDEGLFLRPLSSQAVRNTLALMYSCGMADYSGQFAFSCGLPAISSVSGCVLVVIPGVAGLALWSPPLDNFGNSCRAVAFCRELVKKYTLHRFSGIGVCRKHLRLPTRAKSLSFEWRRVEDRTMQVMLAAAWGDLRFLKVAFFRGVDLSGLRDHNGRTPLHVASAEGHVECVRFLLVHAGAKTSALDKFGHCPGWEAERAKRQDVVELLKANNKET